MYRMWAMHITTLIVFLYSVMCCVIAFAREPQPGEILSRQAIAYYKEQHQEKAFSTFLNALEITPYPITVPNSKAEENALYEKALQIYLSDNAHSKQENSKKILQEYGESAAEHPDYYLLGYLISSAEANLDQFPEFFERFYRSYVNNPDHYLAHKAKAVLSIKLQAKGRTPVEKERWREKSIANLHRAIDLYPFDASLYKMLLTFASEGEKKILLIYILNKIIDNNAIIPRTDIAVYIQQALAYKQIDLAQCLVDKSRTWYGYSRTMEELQNKIRQQQER